MSTNLLSVLLAGSSSTANLTPGVPGATAGGWAMQTGLGAEGLGEDGEKPAQELPREMHRLVGEAECWKGPALYCSNTSFPCVQAKVTRRMIYLAQGKQLFRGSAGVFRQSCSVPEESHLQMLTASFYPLPASLSPAVISHQAVLRMPQAFTQPLRLPSLQFPQVLGTAWL